MEGRVIVANYLNSKKSFILVSHDRGFLDLCIDHVLSINKINIEIQQGNFSSWYQNKEYQDNFEVNKNDKLKKDIYHLKTAATRTSGWSDKIEKGKIGDHEADRGRVGHLAAKMMKRSKSIEKRQNDAIDEKQQLMKNIDSSSKLKMSILEHHNKRYIEVSDLSISYDHGAIFEPISFVVNEGDRIAIKGGNGSGKTSLFKALLGEHIQHMGSYKLASGLKISYMSQDTSDLSGSLNDYAEANHIDETLLFTVLRQLNFPRTQFDKNIEDYSDGQKKKVLLAKSLIEPSHLFIWDEPLNYIDILSRIQIEEVIEEFQPTLIFVEHDKRFMEKVSTKIVELR
jgi:lincosamide and streptogramin A transport system ATP-binding/permease protein